MSTTDSRILVATRIAASETLRYGLRDAASDAAYELLARRRGLGPDDDLADDDPLWHQMDALARRAVDAGLHAAMSAMVPLLEAV